MLQVFPRKFNLVSMWFDGEVSVVLGRCLRCFILLQLVFVSSAAWAKKEVWVYTSIYKEFAAPIEAAFEAKNPDINLQIFQAGSEKIQAKVESELLAKKVQADIVVTSDPFWSAELEKRGLSFAPKGQPAQRVNYNSLMVIIVNKSLPAASRPSSFADLTKTQFKDLIQSGSPLESGSAFAAVAYLSDKLGWTYFEGLRNNGLSSTGGNSLVIQKVESGEKKIGVVLLENALASVKRGSPIEIVYPVDGGILIPSTQVVLKDGPQPELARKFGDFLLTTEGQKLLVKGFMYPVDAKAGTPEGAQPLAAATKGTKVFTAEFVAKTNEQSKSIKRKFAELILE